MEKRSDRYRSDEETSKIVKSRVTKNNSLYDDINTKIGYEEIPTYETNSEINLSSLDMNNLKRSEYQKVKSFKEIIDTDEEKEEIKIQDEPKVKNYDINKVLEEAKKNRKADELEGKRNLKEEDYDVLNNLNRKYLHQKGFTEEDNEELKELIDTITSKTMVDDIKDEEEKELLSELLATTIDIKLENELSQTQIQELADENLKDELEDSNSFYSKSLDLSNEDLMDDTEAQTETEKETNNEEFINIEEEGNAAKIAIVVILLIIIIIVVAYFVLKFLGIKI